MIEGVVSKPSAAHMLRYALLNPEIAAIIASPGNTIELSSYIKPAEGKVPAEWVYCMKINNDGKETVFEFPKHA